MPVWCQALRVTTTACCKSAQHKNEFIWDLWWLNCFIRPFEFVCVVFHSRQFGVALRELFLLNAALSTRNACIRNQKTKDKISLRKSLGLNWENKTCKLKRSIDHFLTTYDTLCLPPPPRPPPLLHKLLPGPSRRLTPVIKCNAFLCFQSYIVRDISLTEIYRWLVTVIDILSAILKSTRYGESRERL